MTLSFEFSQENNKSADAVDSDGDDHDSNFKIF
jgi:hypothetical protein